MVTSTFRSTSSPTTAEDRAVRVEDYLDDKLQTFADLENLDSLFESVRNQKTLLDKQVGSPLPVVRDMSNSGSCRTQSPYIADRPVPKLVISMSMSGDLRLSGGSRRTSIDDS